MTTVVDPNNKPASLHVDDDGNLLVSGDGGGGGGGGGDASAAKQDEQTAILEDIATSVGSIPAGGATAAKQDTGNTSLASIDTKTPALGQALAAASVPVVLTAAQIATLTPPAAITGFATAAKQDTGNASLASIASDLAGTLAVSAASLPLPTGAATSAAQTTAQSSLTSIDGKLTTENTNSGTLAGVVSSARAAVNLISGQAGVDGGSGASSSKTVRVILSSDSPGGTGGGGGSSTKTIDVTITRPNDTTTYAAGDVVSNSTSAATIMTFANAVTGNGKGGMIQGAILIDSISATLKPDFELYLFDTAPTMQNDNAAWAPTDSEVLRSIGMISFPGGYFRTMGANGQIEMDALSKSFNALSSDTSIYGILVTRNAYIPTALETFTVRLKIIQES